MRLDIRNRRFFEFQDPRSCWPGFAGDVRVLQGPGFGLIRSFFYELRYPTGRLWNGAAGL